MPKRKKPETQKLQLDELWDAVIGTNGKGILAQFDSHIEWGEGEQEKNVKKLDEISVMLATVIGKLEGHMGTAPPTRRQINKQKIIEVVLVAGVLGIIVFVAILIWLKAIAPDDIIQIIKAIRSQ